jgi:hypothetical protein
MADTIRCASCGDENPADARFCIDCGASLAPAAIGQTTRLPGVPCPTCRANNPENARFCVVCGTGLIAGAMPPRPRPAPTRPPPHSHPRVDVQPSPMPMAPPAPPVQRKHHGFHPIGAIVLVVGFLLLFGTRSIWPGILWVLAIWGVVNALSTNQPNKAIQSLVWWGGLAILFMTGGFWPGILILIFVNMAFGGWGWPNGRGHW